MEKKKIGILYICTGPYCLFWEDFYNSFEEKFLPDFEKHYFVFTDAAHIYGEDATDRIRRYKLEAMPWPLVTLLRFNTFLSIEDVLQDMDYLMFSNANVICNQIVEAQEFLPDEALGQQLFVTHHPGYCYEKPHNVPYDRNPKSLAYIPWNCGCHYVIGAMFGGTRQAFLEMSKTLKYHIEEDLKKNVIAQWHDESHLNRYIAGRNDYRLLHPGFCYPVGFDLPVDNKIMGVSKQAKFDVKTFKGNYDVKKSNPVRRLLGKIRRKLRVGNYLLSVRDKCLGRSLEII